MRPSRLLPILGLLVAGAAISPELAGGGPRPPLTPFWPNDPPAHGWIALQAHRALAEDPIYDGLRREMEGYLPVDERSCLYSGGGAPGDTACDAGGNFSEPSRWRSSALGATPTCVDAAGCPPPESEASTALIEGAWAEDYPPTRTVAHFWSPLDGFDAGLVLSGERFPSALQKAEETTFARALEAYRRRDLTAAYYWLGRTAHLLMDMSSPAHVLNDQHAVGSDRLEDYSGSPDPTTRFGFRRVRWAYREPPLAYTDPLDPSWEYPYRRSLADIFYTYAVSARRFDTRDFDGAGGTVAVADGQGGVTDASVGRGLQRRARNRLAPGRVVSSIELCDLFQIVCVPAASAELEVRYASPSCPHRAADSYVYYAKELWERIQNPAVAVRVRYTSGDVEKLPKPDSAFPFAEDLDCVYLPALESRAIASVAELYELFWDETHRTDPGELHLQGGRVKVTVAWRSPYSGETGRGTPLPQLDTFGYFTFFDPANPEVFVKVLDWGSGTPYLVFYGGLTDFEYTVTVTVVATGQKIELRKPAGTFDGGADTASLLH